MLKECKSLVLSGSGSATQKIKECWTHCVLFYTFVSSPYRDLVGKKCEERGILFRPIPSKYQEGKQVYQCGGLNIYLDRHAIFVKKDGMWIPTSLNSMLDSAAWNIWI